MKYDYGTPTAMRAIAGGVLGRSWERNREEWKLVEEEWRGRGDGECTFSKQIITDSMSGEGIQRDSGQVESFSGVVPTVR